jgi:hypothetical protein
MAILLNTHTINVAIPASTYMTTETFSVPNRIEDAKIDGNMATWHTVDVGKAMLPNTMRNVDSSNETAKRNLTLISINLTGILQAGSFAEILHTAPDGNYGLDSYSAFVNMSIIKDMNSVLAPVAGNIPYDITYDILKWKNVLSIKGNVTLNRVYTQWNFPVWVTLDYVPIKNPYLATPTGTEIIFANFLGQTFLAWSETDLFGDTIANAIDNHSEPNCPFYAADYVTFLNEQAAATSLANIPTYKDHIVHLPNIEDGGVAYSPCDFDTEFAHPSVRNTGMRELLGYTLDQCPLVHANELTTADTEAYVAINPPNIENSIEALHLHTDFVTNALSAFSTNGAATDVIAIIHVNAPPGNYIVYEPMNTREYNIQPGVYTQFIVYVTDQNDQPIVLYDMPSYVTLNIKHYGRYTN